VLGVSFRNFTDIDQEDREIQKSGEIQNIVDLLEDAAPEKVRLVHTVVKDVLDWCDS
jgi:hypothetical protein